MAQIMEDTRRDISYLACTRETWLLRWLRVRDCFLTGCAAPRPVPVQLQLCAERGEGGRGERGVKGENNFYTEEQCHVTSDQASQGGTEELWRHVALQSAALTVASCDGMQK